MNLKARKSKSEIILQQLNKLKSDVDFFMKNNAHNKSADNIHNEVSKLYKLIPDYIENEKHQTIQNDFDLREKLGKAEITNQIELSPDNIWLIDLNFNIVSTNQNFKNSFKQAYDVPLYIGANIIDSLPLDLKNLWKERYQKALNGERYSVIDNFRLSGKDAYYETTFNPLLTEDGIIGVSCFSRDITEQRTIQIALAESEERYKTLISNVPSVFYRCVNDKEWTMELISDEIEHLSGYSAQKFVNYNKRNFTSIIHPDDRKYVENCVNEGIFLKKKFEMEYRLLHANGSIVWVQESGKAHYLDNGEVAWLDGFINNITKRKKAEQALSESEKQYRHIFLSISDLFLKTNLKGEIILVTPSVKDILGYTPEEIIGKKIVDIMKYPTDFEALSDSLEEKEKISDFETVLFSKRKDEKTLSFDVRSFYIDNQKGGIEGIGHDITERKIAEESLRERTKELYSIFDNAPLILILADKSGKIININRATSRYGEGKQQEILNKLSNEAVKCIIGAHNKKGCGKGKMCEKCVIRNTFLETISTQQNYHQVEGVMQVEIDNQEIVRQVLISTTYIEFEEQHRVLLSLDDITELKAVQEQVKKLSVAVEQSTATIVITDINGRIEYVNPHFEKTTGYKLSDVSGENPRILKSNKVPKKHYKELWETILSGKTWQGEFLNLKKDGTEYWENAIISPIFDDNGKIINFIAIKDDITERKQIQEELIRSEQELRQLNEEKSRFFSILAHDLRGMVGAFYGHSHLLATEFDTFSTDEVKEFTELLQKSSRDSLELLDNLLEWARASQENIALSPIILNLNEEVKNVVNYLEGIAKAKGIELSMKIESKINLYADKNVLTTIIRNLINNAIKFTPSDGIIIVSAEKISKNIVEVSVADTGIGMDSNTLNSLFKPGEGVLRHGTNNEKGTGLGLMICNEMVKRLNGTIHVESKPGKGSRFYFQIPVQNYER